MAKKMLIDATHAEETRVVVVDGNKVEEFDFETVNRRQLAGNIYLAKVTRVEPSLQAAFIDYGGNRHGFLAFSEIHPDYYQIPVADRQALLAEERAYAEQQEAEEASGRSRRSSQRRGGAPKAAARDDEDAVAKGDIPGMGVVDLDEDGQDEGVNDAAAGDDATPEAPYVAADHASDTDEDIESVADEDVSEEIAETRKPRPRRYKIQEVVKVRQILLVQVVKEERGNKGAALTTYLSLAGRYCVLMPNTARGGGISRKITNVVDRKKLKEIAGEMSVPQGAGLIIRTAGSQRTKTEIKRDYEYLMRLWEQIRDLTMKSTAPAPIYAEGDLIKRTIRDLYNKDIDEVLVEGEAGFIAAKDFMRMIMPSHARHVKLYTESMPLFARFQVESYLGAMFNPVVQLKSGGYIVIGVTEALVAIDVNSGRSTKEGSIEDTALKTNLEAAEEVARQLRLRDLAGLIVIDFIDMEERRNNASVEKRLKEKLKTDRARIQVGRISGFGLLEMSRQRLRPGMLESTTQPCAHCHGTGIIRSDDSLSLSILRQLEEEGTRKRSREVLLRAPVAVVNFLMNQKREHVAQIEARFGMSVRIEADPSLVSPDFHIEKFKTATRAVPEPSAAIVSANASLMSDYNDDDIVEEDEAEEEAEAEVQTRSGDDTEARGGGPRGEDDPDGPRKKKRRRRRRRKGGGANGQPGEGNGDQNGDEDRVADGGQSSDAGSDTSEGEDKPARRRSRSRRPRSGEGREADAAEAAEAAEAEVSADAPDEPAAKPASRRKRTTKAAEADAVETVAEEPAKDAVKKPAARRAKAAPKADGAEAKAPTAKKPAAKAKADDTADAEKPAKAPRARASRAKPKEAEATTVVAMPDPAPAPKSAKPVADPEAAKAEPDASDKPKKRGWWSLGR